jgi:hypothetical protein
LSQRRIRYGANRFQFAALKSQKKITAVFKGVGAGGTDAGSHWVITRMRAHAQRQRLANGERTKLTGLIGANTYGQLRDSTLVNFDRYLEKYRVRHIKFAGDKRMYHFPQWNVDVLYRSMDNFEVLAGMEIGFYWLDEAWGTERAAFDLLNARLRQKGGPLQALLTTTTDEPTSWLYDVFVLEAAHKPEMAEMVGVHYGTTEDNKANLPPGYIEMLKATYDPKMYERMVLSKWVSVSRGKMLYMFDRVKHVRRLGYDARLPLMVSSDFNVDPMSWTVWQKHGTGENAELWCIDEIVLPGNADTAMACRELRRRYVDPWNDRQAREGFEDPLMLRGSGRMNVLWFGDASGNSRSTKSNVSDYEIIRNHFPDVELEMRVRSVNPGVRESANAVNARLQSGFGEVRLLFDEEKTPHTIASCEGVSYLPGTTEKDDSMDRNPNSKVKTHLSDTVRYLVQALYPIMPMVQGRQYDSAGRQLA